MIDLLALHLLKDSHYHFHCNQQRRFGKSPGRGPWMIILVDAARNVGHEICRILKADAVTRHIPIIMLTAKGARPIARMIYVTKP